MPPQEPRNMVYRPEKLLTPLPPRKYEVFWLLVVLYLYGHLAALYGLYLCFTDAKWRTIGLAYLWYVMAELGIVCGAHRLWSHRSFKAKLPLEIMLMLFQSASLQNTGADWARNHRLHHKHSDTDADPHNSSRGLFFSHMGWLLVRKHPDVKEKGKGIEMTDIYNNQVLRFQKKYKAILLPTICFVLPVAIPMYCWGESINAAWNVNLLRLFVNFHTIFLVNSVAHKYGYRPYDGSIIPTEAGMLCSIVTLGEGSHNFHHAFPWDYRSAELGNITINFSKWFIDFFAKVGWAYDLKTVSEDVIKNRMIRTGDGSKSWGWGDKDMTREERDSAKIILPQKSTEEIKDDQIPKKVDITKIYSHDYFRFMDQF